MGESGCHNAWSGLSFFSSTSVVFLNTEWVNRNLIWLDSGSYDVSQPYTISCESSCKKTFISEKWDVGMLTWWPLYFLWKQNKQVYLCSGEDCMPLK